MRYKTTADKRARDERWKVLGMQVMDALDRRGEVLADLARALDVRSETAYGYVSGRITPSWQRMAQLEQIYNLAPAE